MVTIIVNQTRAVLRWTTKPLRFGYPGIAFDGVEGQTQPSGAVQQPDPTVEQRVHGVPTFECGLLPGEVLARRPELGPATAVGGHRFLDEASQSVPQSAGGPLA